MANASAAALLRAASAACQVAASILDTSSAPSPSSSWSSSVAPDALRLCLGDLRPLLPPPSGDDREVLLRSRRVPLPLPCTWALLLLLIAEVFSPISPAACTSHRALSMNTSSSSAITRVCCHSGASSPGPDYPARPTGACDGELDPPWLASDPTATLFPTGASLRGGAGATSSASSAALAAAPGVVPTHSVDSPRPDSLSSSLPTSGPVAGSAMGPAACPWILAGSN